MVHGIQKTMTCNIGTNVKVLKPFIFGSIWSEFYEVGEKLKNVVFQYKWCVILLKVVQECVHVDTKMTSDSQAR